MLKIRSVAKAAFNYCGVEVSRLQRSRPEQRHIELEYDLHIAPRWGHGLQPNKLIEKPISEGQVFYAQTLNGFMRRKTQLSTIPYGSLAENPALPCWTNDFFSGFDAASLVCFILETQPQVYLEIGSGNSTKFARHAINLGNLQTKVISVDPHPRAEIDTLCDDVIRLPLEQTDHQIFSILRPGDILFFDGSHRIFTNSDVAVFFLEVLPALRPGILVHVHDIFLPFDYPPEWNQRFYSEQYMLAAMLLCQQRPFDIVLPNCYVMSDPTLSKAPTTLMSGTGIEPGPVSFWIRTRKS
jgi:hypothetical protein